MEILNAEIKTRIEMISRGEVPEGYKKTKVGIIPEDWEVKKLAEFLELKNGINAKKVDYGHGIKFINVLDILNNNYIVYENIIGNVNIDEKKIEDYSVCYGDILFQRSSETIGEVGYANVYLDKKIATFGGFVIRGKKLSDYEPLFLKELLNSPMSRRQIESSAGGSTRFNIGQKELYKIKLSFPPLPEQQKIAQVLSTWDEAIELKEKLIEQKKQQKKGLMQRLLTGEVRLPGFDGEWEEVELKDVCKLETGKRPKGGANEIGDIPSLGGENINNDNGLNLDNVRKISNEFYNSMEQGKLKENDILINKDGANTGKVALYKNSGLEKAAINEHLFIIRPKNKNIDYKFLYYYLASTEARNKISARITSSAQPGLNSKFINGFYLLIPSYNEQIRIGNVLYTIDKEIDLLNQELELLKLQKKGLMQLLLTGIVRVN